MDEKKIKKQLALRIKSYRKEKGLTQDEIATSIGFEQKNFSRYENEKTLPDTITLCKLISKTSMTPDYLLGFLSDNKEYSNLDFELLELLISLPKEAKLSLKEFLTALKNKS